MTEKAPPKMGNVLAVHLERKVGYLKTKGGEFQIKTDEDKKKTN